MAMTLIAEGVKAISSKIIASLVHAALVLASIMAICVPMQLGITAATPWCI